jgi:hypothetical protein
VVYCAPEIERQAQYDVKWTDGFLRLKFEGYRWLDQAKHSITYVGDRVMFQNGFGAWSPMIYECDLSGDGKTVLAVRVEPGRLPVQR